MGLQMVSAALHPFTDDLCNVVDIKTARPQCNVSKQPQKKQIIKDRKYVSIVPSQKFWGQMFCQIRVPEAPRMRLVEHYLRTMSRRSKVGNFEGSAGVSEAM
jgi:hypothetical protein